MPLVKTSVVLQEAGACGHAVAAFNVFNYETVRWVLKAAEEEKSSVIIQFYPGFTNLIPLSTIAAIAMDLAACASIPAALHMDHSFSYEQAVSGLNKGFGSIMIDGSSLPFLENIRLTRSVVEAAGPLGIEVEAELGRVGSGKVPDDFTNPHHFTEPDDAARFIRETGADSLAVSIGNAHGAYAAAPSLDFERLNKIRDAVTVPLVLHGGSDIPDGQLREAVKLGIRKVNIATEYERAFLGALRAAVADEKETYLYKCLMKAEEPVKEFIKGKIRLLKG